MMGWGPVGASHLANQLERRLIDVFAKLLARADGGDYNWGSDISGVYGEGDASGDWYIAGEGWSVANF
jgi:hypothetical protein